MIVCLAFIGVLPKYIIECVHQIRIYCQDEIYLIINDVNSIHLQALVKYNIIIVNYADVLPVLFLQTVNKNKRKFKYVNGLIGREALFVRCFERFFVLHNLLVQIKKEHCLFL